jgi:hypothetical protein
MSATTPPNQTSFDPRHKKGVRIVAATDSIKKLSKNLYTVKSQTGKGWYEVFRTVEADLWSCTCADFSGEAQLQAHHSCSNLAKRH